MAAKENFFKAMKELAGVNPVGEENYSETEDLDITAKPIKNVIENPYDSLDVENKETERRKALFEVEKIPEVTKPFSSATIISSSMIINGEMKSTGDIEILGIMKGPVTTTGNLNIEGKVLGNIKGKNILLKGCAVQGNVVASGDILVDTDSVIVGDIQGNNVQVNGKVKGWINVQEMLELNKDAVVDGDASSRYIAMNQGAKLNGKVSVISDGPKDDGTFNIKFDV